MLLGHNRLCFDNVSAIDFYVSQGYLAKYLDTQRLQKSFYYAIATFNCATQKNPHRNVLQMVNRNPRGNLESQSYFLPKPWSYSELTSFVIIGFSKCFAVCQNQEWNLWNWTVHKRWPRQRSMVLLPNYSLLSSGVGTQSAAPGSSRKCRPLMRVAVVYLWRHCAQSTVVWSFVFWRPLCKTFRQI